MTPANILQLALGEGAIRRHQGVCYWRHAREEQAQNEVSLLEHIAQAIPKHKGWHFVTNLLDLFTLDSIYGKHACLIFKPLREPLWLYCQRFIGGVIPPDLLKIILQMTLHELDYLHSQCQIIHAGRKMKSQLHAGEVC